MSQPKSTGKSSIVSLVDNDSTETQETNMNTPTEAASDVLADDFLADLELTPETVDDDLIETTLDAEAEAAVETAIEIDEAYEGQSVSTAGATSEDAPAPAAEETKKARRERKAGAAKKASAPKIERDLTKIDPALFALSTSAPADLEANRNAVIATRPTQKKIAEKFDNLFQSLAAGRAPSVYVMQCFDVLKAKGTVSQGDLVAGLKAADSRKGSTYNEGTARSQAGQIMALFNIVGIATRTGSSLSLNADSAIAKRLEALPR